MCVCVCESDDKNSCDNFKNSWYIEELRSGSLMQVFLGHKVLRSIFILLNSYFENGAACLFSSLCVYMCECW